MVEWLKNKKGGLSLRYFLAIDIGASSGRHIVGWQENGEIKTNEVYRFPNGVQEENGHLTWDVCKLFANVVDSILKAFKQYSQLESLSIDAWGVDYVPPRLGRAQRRQHQLPAEYRGSRGIPGSEQCDSHDSSGL